MKKKRKRAAKMVRKKWPYGWKPGKRKYDGHFVFTEKTFEQFKKSF